MKRVTLFAKGNVDIHDSLHSCHVGGKLLWNGLNEVLRTAHPHVSARLRHETLTRSDALLAARGVIPEVIAARDLALGSYPAASQFSDKLFTLPVDAVILSIQADITDRLVRHKADGFLFYPSEASGWSEDNRQWLRLDFTATPLLTVEESMANLAEMVDRIRQIRDIPVLIYNLSPVIPGDFVHCYMGLDETYATRIRRFNLALIELSQNIGISIVDVDALMARYGADRLKLDTVHLTPEGYQRVAEEVVRILDDLGIFDEESA